MKKPFSVIILLFPIVLLAQQDSIPAGLYRWKSAVTKTQKNILSAVLFEGSTTDMQHLQMSANTILYAKKKTQLHSSGEESLLIIRSGTLIITMKDSSWTVGKGSIALIMPGENCSLQCADKNQSEFYLMKYSSKLPVDVQRGKNAGGSTVIDWNNVAFKPHDKGGIRNFTVRPTAMIKRFEMHVSTLNEGLKSHDPHTHRAAEIVIMINGDAEMQVGSGFYKGNAGDVYYLASNVPHAIRNDGKGDCMYFAFQFQ